MRSPGLISRAAGYVLTAAASLSGAAIIGSNSGCHSLDTLPTATPITNPTDVNSNGMDMGTNGVSTNSVAEQPNILETTAQKPREICKGDLEAGYVDTTGIRLGLVKYTIDNPPAFSISQGITTNGLPSPGIASWECEEAFDKSFTDCYVRVKNNPASTLEEGETMDVVFPFTFGTLIGREQGLEGLASQGASAYFGFSAGTANYHTRFHGGNCPGFTPDADTTGMSGLEVAGNWACNLPSDPTKFRLYEVPKADIESFMMDSNAVVNYTERPILPRDSEEGSFINFATQAEAEVYVMLVGPDNVNGITANVIRARDIAPNAKAIGRMESAAPGYNPPDCPWVYGLDGPLEHGTVLSVTAFPVKE